MPQRYPPDLGLFAAVLLLVAFGLIMLSSLSVYNSYNKIFGQKVTEYCETHLEASNCYEEDGRKYAEAYCNEYNCNNLYFKRQVQSVAVALLLGLVGFLTPVAVWRVLAPLIFLLGIFLLLLVFSPLGASYGTSRSWLNIPVLRSLQPVEVAKIGLVLYFAIWMSKKQNEIRTFRGGFVPFVILVSLVIVPVAFQPDFGSVLIIGLIATIMFYVAGGNFWHIVEGGLLASLLAWPVILSHRYIQLRFLSLFFPELAAEDDKYQIDQSLLGIGSGRILGAGLGNSTQRHGWLPEIQGDFIFSGIAEEMGFLRLLFFLGIFFYIAWRGFRIARNAPDRFSSLVATGITSWIALQASINALVALGLFPLTGITLPFVSYGGSSLVMGFFAVGILLHISSLSPQTNSFPRKRSGIFSFSP